MNNYQILESFLRATYTDSRINKSHLALYFALFMQWSATGFTQNFKAFSKEIMPVAKISSSATYHRLLKDLLAYGYLGYESSFTAKSASRFILCGPRLQTALEEQKE